jgi:hypothetical protein
MASSTRYWVSGCCSEYVVMDSHCSHAVTGHLEHDEAEREAERLNTEEDEKSGVVIG